MMRFNPSQKRAIAHLSGPMMALAGPGSGKTSVIVERIRCLIEEHRVSPSEILVVTFSREAAREMKERFFARTKQRYPVTFGTFHGVFYSILRRAYGLTSENILGEERKHQILRALVEKEDARLLAEGEFLEELSREIGQVKGQRIAAEHYYSSSCPSEIFRNVFDGYRAECSRLRVLDFEDMLVMCWELLTQRKDILQMWQRRFRYLLIDEFQDINRIQYDIVRLLALPEDNLFAVGDDDQSIYYFRGARPELMLHFQKDYPKAQQVLLDVNYRCTPEILEAAMRLIGHNRTRYRKALRAAGAHGEKPRVFCFQTPGDEAKFLVKELLAQKKQEKDLSDTAVLFRTHIEAEGLVQLLMEYNLPFQMKDRLPNLFDHWLARDILTYLKLAHGGRSRADFLKVMNRPNRYLSREAVYDREVSFEALRIFYEEKDWMCERIDELEHHLRVLASLPPFAAIVFLRRTVGYDAYVRDYALERKLNPEELFEILDRLQESAKEADSYPQWLENIEQYRQNLEEQRKKEQPKKEGVVLSTLHSVKGLEYENVYIFNLNEGLIPYQKAVLPEQLEEERRLLYVGMTRAKKRLTLCFVKTRYDKEKERSRFLEELAEERSGG